MTHREDLRSEFVTIRQFLDGTRADDATFSSRLAHEQMGRRLAAISEELQAIDAGQLDLRILGDVAERHALPVMFFKNIVERMQTAYTYASWAFRAGPLVEGNVPAGVARSSELEVLALAPGSFRFALRRVPEHTPQEQIEPESDPRVRAMASMVAVFEGAAASRFDEKVEEAVRDMGKEASRRIELLVRKLAEHDATVEFDLQGPTPPHASLSPEHASTLSSWLRSFDEELEDFDVIGVLRVIDTVRGRFAIEDAAGRLFDGKAAVELLHGAEEGLATYRARVQAIRRFGDHTGAASERLMLVSLQRSTVGSH